VKRKISAAVFFAAAAMLAFAGSAGAVDGTIEINDAKVKAAGGYPGKITGQGSYRLTGNLTPPASTDGIDVSASDVTIDLNGFAIIGPGSSSLTPSGINASTVDDATVENGTVTGFAFGVELGNFGIARNLHADNNGSGISTGFDSVVEDCTANNSTLAIEFAIGCGGASAMSGNTANGNANYGIYCAGNGCVISGNTANANTGVGIYCDGSGCLVSRNAVYKNGTGIKANDSSSGFAWNVVDNNGTRFSGGNSLSNNLCGGSSC